MLRCLVSSRPKQWDGALAQAEFAYNCMQNRSTGLSPFAIVYTKPPSLTTDLSLPTSGSHATAEQLATTFTDIQQQVTHSLEFANAKYKQQADKHRRQKDFTVGDLVVVFLRRERFPSGTYHKLQNKKIGPFPILCRLNDNTYVVDLPLEFHISHTFNVADLFEYFPPDAAPTLSSSLKVKLFVSGEEC